MAFEIENGVLTDYIEEQGITEVVIPDDVTSIGDCAFCMGGECLDYSSLTSVTIPDSVTRIGDEAFGYCANLESVNIPDSVTSIGNSAFSGCSSLTEIKIPDGITSIGNKAFYNCSSLTEINIPDSVTRIGDKAFGYCANLESVNIPDSVTSIGDWAFYKCSSLTEIKIPDSITKIGDEAFGYCANLTEINVSSNNKNYTSVDGVVYNKDITELILCPFGKEKVTIPDGVTNIGDFVFYDCSSLESVTIPDSVTRIGISAFHCYHLRLITFQSTKLKELKIKTYFNCDDEDFWREESYYDYDDDGDEVFTIYYDFDEFFMRLHYMSCDDQKEEARKYLLEKLSVNESELDVMLLKEIIEDENVAFINHISKTGDFLTEDNIDELIDYARDRKKLEISVILMNYKHEHFGFDDPLKDFVL